MAQIELGLAVKQSIAYSSLVAFIMVISHSQKSPRWLVRLFLFRQLNSNTDLDFIGHTDIKTLHTKLLQADRKRLHSFWIKDYCIPSVNMTPTTFPLLSFVIHELQQHCKENSTPQNIQRATAIVWQLSLTGYDVPGCVEPLQDVTNHWWSKHLRLRAEIFV